MFCCLCCCRILIATKHNEDRIGTDFKNSVLNWGGQFGMGMRVFLCFAFLMITYAFRGFRCFCIFKQKNLRKHGLEMRNCRWKKVYKCSFKIIPICGVRIRYKKLTVN